MVWWWITGAALGAIGLAVIGNEIEKNEKAQREYEEKKIKYYENIEELKQGIEKEKERNRKGYDNFDNLVQLHCLSFKNGDYAYKAKEDLKSIINNDYIAIDKIKEKQKELYIQIKNKFFKYNLINNIKDVYNIKYKRNQCIFELKNLNTKKLKLQEIIAQYNEYVKTIRTEQADIYNKTKNPKLSNEELNKLHSLLKEKKSEKLEKIKMIEIIKKELKDITNKLEKLDNLNKELKNIISINEYENFLDLEETKKVISEDIKKKKHELYEFKKDVQDFNEYTKNLKEYIRDNCGNGGRMWYERLESRIAEKRR